MAAWFDKNHLYILLAIGIIFTFVCLYYFRAVLKLNVLAAIIVALLCTGIGLYLVRAFAFLEGNKNKGAMSLFGGVLFMPVFFLLGAKITKRSMQKVCDILTPAMLFTMALTRVNCLISGCCIGKVISHFSNTTLRWPNREIELVYYLLMLLLCFSADRQFYLGKESLFLREKGKILMDKIFVSGSLYPLYMMSYGALRFILEFIRQKEETTVFHLSHLWAILAFGIGALFYFQLRAEEKIKDRNRKKRQSGKR